MLCDEWAVIIGKLSNDQRLIERTSVDKSFKISMGYDEYNWLKFFLIEYLENGFEPQIQPGENHSTPVTTEGPVVTDINGNYQAFPTVMLNEGGNLTAHYAGAPPVNALAASSGSTFIGPQSG